jgi:hypothetical protein
MRCCSMAWQSSHGQRIDAKALFAALLELERISDVHALLSSFKI